MSRSYRSNTECGRRPERSKRPWLIQPGDPEYNPSTGNRWRKQPKKQRSSLSTHFMKRWRQRVMPHGAMGPDEALRLIREDIISVRHHNTKMVWRESTIRVHYRIVVCGLGWHVVFDEAHQTLVTVFRDPLETGSGFKRLKSP